MNETTDNPLDLFRLDDRLIVITGASEGIGRAFAEAYARAGANIVLVSRRREKLEEVRAVSQVATQSSLLHAPASPLGSLTPADAPLIDAENLFRQPEPALSAPLARAQ